MNAESAKQRMVRLIFVYFSAWEVGGAPQRIQGGTWADLLPPLNPLDVERWAFDADGHRASEVSV